MVSLGVQSYLLSRLDAQGWCSTPTICSTVSKESGHLLIILFVIKHSPENVVVVVVVVVVVLFIENGGCGKVPFLIGLI